MCIGTSGAARVEGLEGPEAVLGASSLETAAALTSLRLDELHLAVECMNLGCDVEDAGVGLVIVSDLCRQAPVIGAAGQVHGLMIGRRLAADGIDEPHWKRLGGGVADIGGGGIQIVVEDGVVLLTEGAECKGDGTVAQLDIARLAHDIVGIGDDEVGESAVIFFKPFGALCVGLTRHLRTKVGELLAELFDLGLGLEMLEGTADSRIGEADGDGAESARIEFRMSLHDVEGALGREGVVVSMDTIDDFALFRLGVWGDGESWACGGMSVFNGWCERGSGVNGFGVGMSRG